MFSKVRIASVAAAMLMTAPAFAQFERSPFDLSGSEVGPSNRIISEVVVNGRLTGAGPDLSVASELRRGLDSRGLD
jgi:hypothetical protein